MNIKVLIKKLNEQMHLMWKNKVFLSGIIVNLSYLIISYVLFFTLFRDSNDFQIFYNSAKVFLNNPENLYEKSNYLWDFRYLPLSTILFIPFSFLDFSSSFVIFNFVTLIINLISSLYIFKIIQRLKEKSHEKNKRRPILYISLFLMGIPHILNYMYGQVNHFVTLLIILALYLYIKRDNLRYQILPSLLIGLSILIKPTSIFLIPFLININFNKGNRRFTFKIRGSFVRITCSLIPILLNFIPFLIFPKMFNDFIEENLSGSFPFSPNFSMSLTKNIMNLFYAFNIPYNQLILLLILIGIIGGFSFISFILRIESKHSLLFGFTLGILIMFLTYYDTWDHHLLNLTPLLIIIIFVLPRNSLITTNQIKPAFFFFNFFNIIFIGVWYLSYIIFPYNFVPVIMLFITLYGLIKILLSNENNRRLDENNQLKLLGEEI